MLYDPKWDAQTQKGPTLEGFVEWLERQPAAGEYNYYAAGLCAWAQYSGREEAILARNIDDIVAPGQWTFGAALERARKLLTTEK